MKYNKTLSYFVVGDIFVKMLKRIDRIDCYLFVESAEYWYAHFAMDVNTECTQETAEEAVQLAETLKQSLNDKYKGIRVRKINDKKEST